jgi:Glycosyl hydrolases family 16
MVLAAGVGVAVAGTDGIGRAGDPVKPAGVNGQKKQPSKRPASPSASPTPTGTASAPATSSPAPTTTPSPTSTSPSGVNMPVGDLPGWRQVYKDDFSGTSLSSDWGRYSGAIPSMPGGYWAFDRVQVANNTLRLLAADRGDGVWTSGGVALAENANPAKRTYGKYVIRVRMDKANGVKYAHLLWPSGGTWPVDGEIDFAEDGGGDRIGTTATTHYADADGSGHYIVQRHLDAVDMSGWQTIGVEWTPGKLVYTINGSPWGEVTSPSAAIPDGPMFLALQTEVNTRGATQWMTTVDSTTPPLVVCEVDWVSVYAPN